MIWAFGRRRRARFERDAQIPFDADETKRAEALPASCFWLDRHEAAIQNCPHPRVLILVLATVLLLTTPAHAADFGARGGPAPANIDAIAEVLRQDPYDMELLISFGTSKGGSAGHLALAIRDRRPAMTGLFGQLLRRPVAPARAGLLHPRPHGRHPEERVPVRHHLVARRQGLVRPGLRRDLQAIGDRRARLRCPSAEKQALEAFFNRINDDYHRRAGYRVPRSRGQVRLPAPELRQDHRLRDSGSARLQGPGSHERAILSRRRLVAAANANIPTEMAMKLLEAWNARGYGLDVVLYRKYAGSS